MKKIPLGSYVEGLLNVPKGRDITGFNKITTTAKFEQRINNAAKYKRLNKKGGSRPQ